MMNFKCCGREKCVVDVLVVMSTSDHERASQVVGEKKKSSMMKSLSLMKDR
jgi:hypothetical protein